LSLEFPTTTQMKSLHFSLFLCFVILSGMVTTGSAEPAKESVYDRVMRTGVIRVAYAMNPPLLMKDPNTGKLTGIFYDVVNRLCAELQLNAEWNEEVGWGQLPEELISGRADIVACGLFVSPTRARVVDYTTMFFYTSEGVWVRPDDHRFDGSLDKINDPSITITTIDGEISSMIAKSTFPKAKVFTLPQMSDLSQNLLNVTTKKADVAFAEPAIATDFIKHNPGTLRNLAADKPFHTYGYGLALKQNEMQFKNMLNLVLQQLIDFGYVEEVLKKYEPAPGVFYRTAAPYVIK
jgi:polar amino acid transport system substrate-binding protein